MKIDGPFCFNSKQSGESCFELKQLKLFKWPGTLYALLECAPFGSSEMTARVPEKLAERTAIGSIVRLSFQWRLFSLQTGVRYVDTTIGNIVARQSD